MEEMYLAWSEYTIPGTSFSMDEDIDILLPRLEAADHIDALTKENERLRELLADMDRTIEWGAACPAFGHQFQERIEAALQEQDDG
jgi:hypothetical protein